MHTNAIRKTMRRFLIRIIVICGSMVLLTNGAYLLMVKLMHMLLPDSSPYLKSEFAFLGAVVLCLAGLSVILAFNYQRRKRELTTLSEYIQKVASGDYSTQITYHKRDAMAQIYRDFNKMSAELSSVQFLKKDFINNFSHEFKTPIASIHGFASLLLERELSREEQREYLTIIKEESDRLSRLTSNTILLSKLSSQDYISNTEDFNLGEQLRQCSIILSHQWLEKDQTFSGEFPDVTFCGNRELMQHLWLNLIGNAIKYTPAGGEITVTLSQSDTIRVQISDTGEGMTQETLEHLFIPYYQGDSSHSGQGLGLGLSIAKQIVTLCEGTISVESTLNEGSTFTVELPTSVSSEDPKDSLMRIVPNQLKSITSSNL